VQSVTRYDTIRFITLLLRSNTDKNNWLDVRAFASTRPCMLSSCTCIYIHTHTITQRFHRPATDGRHVRGRCSRDNRKQIGVHTHTQTHTPTYTHTNTHTATPSSYNTHIYTHINTPYIHTSAHTYTDTQCFQHAHAEHWPPTALRTQAGELEHTKHSATPDCGGRPHDFIKSF
jgi:hypothetical protein